MEVETRINPRESEKASEKLAKFRGGMRRIFLGQSSICKGCEEKRTFKELQEIHTRKSQNKT